MPRLEAAVYTRLTTHPGLSALVGTKVYRSRAPLDARLPFVTYQRISAVRWSCFGADTGVARARIQTTSWHRTPELVGDVKEQVRAALQRWRGTVAGVEVMDSFLADERDFFDEEHQEEGTGETGAYGVALDVLIPYREV